MFENETEGLVSIGAEEQYLGGAQVVLGIADYEGNLIGWFGDEYHPNVRGSVDEIGAEEYPIEPSFLVLGLADEDDNIIGWFGSSFLKKVGKAITAPVKAAVSIATAPVKAGIAIAKGKPVLKSLAKAAGAPITATARMTGSMVTPVFGTKAGTAIARAGAAPAKLVTNIASGKNVGKSLVAAGKAQVQAGTATLAVAKPVLKVAAPIIKSPITKAIVGGVAIAFPPVGLPAAAALASANLALPAVQKAASMATLALSTADKVLAAAKGKLPAQKTAPPIVAKALQTAAKKSVAATYALAKSGDPSAKRGIQVLVAAKKVQAAIPAAQSLIKPAATVVTGGVYDGNLVTKDRKVQRGRFQALTTGTGAGVVAAPLVLKTGVVVKSNWKTA